MFFSLINNAVDCYATFLLNKSVIEILLQYAIQKTMKVLISIGNNNYLVASEFQPGGRGVEAPRAYSINIFIRVLSTAP